MDASKVKIHPKWQIALREEFAKPYFDQLSSQLKSFLDAKTVVYPLGTLIFAAYDACPPEDVKVVILGQDPYHNPGEAMGLSFSVPNGVKIPASLKNIYKELAEDIGTTMPSHGNLSSWANQGVFLLNAMLTVEKNSPGSHKNLGWQQFTDATIQYLSEHHAHIVFMLWGNFAKSKKVLIDDKKHLILEAAHPSPLAGGAFFGCNHFSKANSYLISKGIKPIDWQVV
jgi:uracil-DNA glycosylase